MDSKTAIDFQKKLDEVLKDTESFVNATNQLKAVKQSLDKYISSVGAIDSKLAEITSKSAECVNYASSFFNGDFTKEIDKLIGDVRVIVADCSASAELLEEQYNELLSSDSLIELQKDHSNILDVIDDVSSKVEEMKATEEANSHKLDIILEAIGAVEPEQRHSFFRR